MPKRVLIRASFEAFDSSSLAIKCLEGRFFLCSNRQHKGGAFTSWLNLVELLKLHHPLPISDMYKHEPHCNVCKCPARKIIERKRFREKYTYDDLLAEFGEKNHFSMSSLKRHFKLHTDVSRRKTVTKKLVTKTKDDREANEQLTTELIELDDFVNLGLSLGMKGLREIEANEGFLAPDQALAFAKLKHEREKLKIGQTLLEKMVMGFVSGERKPQILEGETVNE